MRNVWDIMPPRPRPRNITKKRRKSSGSLTFFFIIVMAIIIGVFISGGQSQPINLNQTSNPAPIATVASKTSPTIKLLNGSGKIEEADRIKKLLAQNDITVTKTENALSIYPETIIYYQSADELRAQEIAKILQEYQARNQPFSQPSSYDLIIVIGGR